MHKLMTTAQVAALFKVEPRTITNRVLRGELKAAEKLPGRTGAYLFDAEEIDKISASKSEAK